MNFNMNIPGLKEVIINEMTDSGLVQKVRSNQDKRAVFIQITEEGTDYFINHVLVYRKRLQEEFEDINEEDCYTMIRMIHTIQKKIQKAYWQRGIKCYNKVNKGQRKSKSKKRWRENGYKW